MKAVVLVLALLLTPGYAMAARLTNGTTDYMVSASSLTLSGSSQLTVAFWLWWDAFANDDHFAMELGPDGLSEGEFTLDPNGGAGVWATYTANAGLTNVNSHGVNRWSAAAWHHIIVVFDRAAATASVNAVVAVYVDGVLQSQVAGGASALSPTAFGNLALYLMARGGVSNFGAGRIAEVALFSGYAFQQMDVDVLYGGGSGSDARALVPTYYWQLCGTSSPEPALAGGVNMTLNGTSSATHPISGAGICGTAGGGGPVRSGTTVTATSCAQPHVRAAITTAVDGDTVVIPAGDCTWTGNLTITKRLDIRGAGIGQTIIRDNRNPDVAGFPTFAPPQILVWNVPADAPPFVSALSGITIYGLGYTTPDFFSSTNRSHRSGIIQVNGDGTSKRFRMHHMEFYPYGTAGMSTYNLMGVIDHSLFHLFAGDGNPANYSFHSSWQGLGYYGDQSYAQPSTMGTDQALYFEDNQFLGAAINFFQFANDSFMGARMVYRHNIYKNLQGGNGHGTDSSGRERGFRHHEVYENDVTYESGSFNSDTWSGFRGGTGVMFNNRVVVNAGASLNRVANIGVDRAGASNHYETFGRCGQYNVSLTSSGTTATATITNPDPDGNGNGYNLSGTNGGFSLWVKITGSAVAGYNGTWPLVTPVPFGETFQFTTTGSGLAPSTGVKESPWDQNSDATGYACLDQAGRGQGDLFASTFDPAGGNSSLAVWPNQVLEPIYTWNNTFNGVDSPIVAGDGADALAENRDFYNCTIGAPKSGCLTGTVGSPPGSPTPKAGYTPFTYPHPLTQQSASASHLRWIFRHKP